jgi:hypothetical protein
VKSLSRCWTGCKQKNKEGQLTFLEPAPLPAHGNEIRVGDRRVVIKLVPEDVSRAAP